MPNARASGRRLAVGNTPTMPACRRHRRRDDPRRGDRGGAPSPRSTRRPARRGRSPSAGGARHRRRGVERADHGVVDHAPVRHVRLESSPSRRSTARVPRLPRYVDPLVGAPTSAGSVDVGVVHPAEVEHRALGADRRQPREVVVGRRRRRRPLQRVGVPRVGAGRRRAGAASATTSMTNGTNDSARTTFPIDAPVQRSKSSIVRVVGDAPRHAVAPEDVHHEERHVEPDDHQPEVDRRRAARDRNRPVTFGHQK